MPDHVKLTGTDNQIKGDAEFDVVIHARQRPSSGTFGSSYYDQFISYHSQVIETFEINIR